MKKFTMAAAAALALATAAPAIADQKTSDDPFVSTQGSLPFLLAGGAATTTTLAFFTIVVTTLAVATGDSDAVGTTGGS